MERAHIEICNFLFIFDSISKRTLPAKKHILHFLFMILLSCVPSLVQACSKHQAKADNGRSVAAAPAAEKEKSCCKKASPYKRCHQCTRSGCGKTCHCSPYAHQFIVLTNSTFKTNVYKPGFINSFNLFTGTFISSDYSSIWTPPKIG